MTAETGLTCEAWAIFWLGTDGSIQVTTYLSRDRCQQECFAWPRAQFAGGPYRILIPIPRALIPPTVRATVEEAPA